MKTRFVYFDLGNVLVHFDHELAVRGLARCSGRPKTLVRQVVFESELQNRYETGLIDSQQFSAAINVGLESNLPAGEILEAISAIFQPNHAILPALRWLQDARIPMGILSNTCEAHWNWVVAKDWPVLADWFGETILSYQVKSMKPAAEIYSVCEQRAGCRADSLFFTDDRAENVAAASERGWQTYQYHSTDELLERLNAWLQA